MLTIPTRGISTSDEQHNVKLDVFSDWIEGTVLFDETELSTVDIVDTLCEELIYNNQDFASEIVEDAWSELKRRQSCMGVHSAFSITSSRIERVCDWRDATGHSFCVLLALAKWYRGWAKQFGSDYNEQGELFEKLTKESLERQFSGWYVYQTGWSRLHSKKLGEVIDKITDILGELKGSPEIWAEPKANEAGLDLLCYRPFIDNRVGIPVYLIQCASGGNWKDKLKTPDITDWRRYIQFAARPGKAFSMPFALLDDDFVRYCGKVDGMFLDRCRLLASTGGDDDNWISSELKEHIVAWMLPRVSNLPRD
ncbi:MAG: hypothetical protein JRF06_03180 [Deltaproteobacteria bacterium]|nr:hypothetical protein [Deltaproteobacteria bacterium]